MKTIKHSRRQTFTQQKPIYTDTNNISIVGASKGGSNGYPVKDKQQSNDNEDIKALQKITGCADAAKVARLGKSLLRLYALQQKQ